MALNTKTCLAEGSANTGFGECFLDPKNIVGAFLVPKNREYTPAETLTSDTFIAALIADTQVEKAGRIYPIGGFEAITDNSEDVTITTLGYGGKSITKEGDYDWSFQFIQGGVCLLKSLRKFNGSSKAVLFYDADGVVYGFKSGLNLKGIPLVLFHANPFKINDGSNATAYTVRFAFKPSYLNDNIGFIESNLAELQDIEGLQDIVLSTTTGSATPVFKIKAKTGCSGDDLYDLYSTELASASLWVATDAAGADLPITSVAVDAALKAWTVTVDGVAKTISLDTAAALSAAGVEGFESLTLTV